jgi:nucleoside-diphosphate-sugar epimerase
LGGTFHAYLARAYPDYEFTLLVRNEEKAKPIKARYPNTKFAYGSLDDQDVVEKAAAEADVVVRKLNRHVNEITLDGVN